MSRLAVPNRTYDIVKVDDWLNGFAGRVVSGSFSWTPGLIGATSEVETTLTTSTDAQMGGLRVGMVVVVNAPTTFNAGLELTHYCVPATDSLTIRVRNSTGGGITPASGTWRFWAFQT